MKESVFRSSYLTFVDENIAVGLVGGSELVAVDVERGQAVWNRRTEMGDLESLAIVGAECGPYFAVVLGDVAQLFHSPTGTALTGRIELQTLARALLGGSGELFFSGADLQVSNSGEMAVVVDDKLMVRRRPMRVADVAESIDLIEQFTGIRASDGETFLEELPLHE